MRVCIGGDKYKMPTEMPRPHATFGIGVGGALVCAALLFTQTFDSAFDLPPEARNLSPFDTSIFRVERIAPAGLD